MQLSIFKYESPEEQQLNEIDSVIQNYASIINREAQDGWTLDHITQVQTHIPAGCLAALIGSKGTYVDHNVLIFSK